MQTNQTATIGSNLAEPINHSVTAANGGQFALLLSFMFEAQAASAPNTGPAAVMDMAAVKADHSSQREFHLELGLENALLSNNQAQLNLMRSLIMERTHQVLAQMVPQTDSFDDRRLAHPQRRNEDLIEEIQKARNLGLRTPGVEQERISLRTGMAAL